MTFIVLFGVFPISIFKVQPVELCFEGLEHAWFDSVDWFLISVSIRGNEEVNERSLRLCHQAVFHFRFSFFLNIIIYAFN